MPASSCSGVTGGRVAGQSGMPDGARERVEIVEEDPDEVVRVGVQEDLPGLRTVFHAQHLRRHHHVVVDEAADRVLAVLDLLLVTAHQRGERFGAGEAEAQDADAELGGEVEGAGAAGRHPEGRVRLGVGLGQDVARRHGEELAVVAVVLVLATCARSGEGSPPPSRGSARSPRSRNPSARSSTSPGPCRTRSAPRTDGRAWRRARRSGPGGSPVV